MGRSRLSVCFSLSTLLLAALASSTSGQNPDYVMRISDAAAAPGDAVGVVVSLDNSGDPLASWDLFVCNDPSVVVIDVAFGQALIETPPDFFLPAFTPEGFFLSIVFDLNPPFDGNLPPGQDLEVLLPTYQMVSDDPNPAALDFCEILFATENEQFVPVTDGGLIYSGSPPVPLFRRGDASGDGSVNGLVDGLHILNFQFIPGTPAPPCLKAADADDNGSISGLVDGLLVLNFFFIPGSPPPPAPGPEHCGSDPTDDGLSCDAITCP